MIDLDEAERIGNSATAGPWDFGDFKCGRVEVHMFEPEAATNMSFAIYARNHWQEMVDELKTLRGLLTTFGKADIDLDDPEIDAAATDEEAMQLVDRHCEAYERIKKASRVYAGQPAV